MGEYFRPTSLNDVCDLLNDGSGEYEIIAGGQSLTLQLRLGLKDPKALVDISQIDELTGIEANGESVTIGAATTYDTLNDSETIRAEFPFFAGALEQISGPQVRNHGTLGGGVCYGDPALDAPPVLLSLDATVTLYNGDRTRELPLREFFTGYYETELAEGEILTEITVPKMSAHSAGEYLTMTPRQGDYAVAGVAILLSADGNGGLEQKRVALTNAGDRPKRAPAVERALTDLSNESITDAGKAVQEELDLIGDSQTPASYKRTVFKQLTKQAIHNSMEKIPNE